MNLKKIIISLFLFFISCNIIQAKPVKFIQFTDVHYRDTYAKEFEIFVEDFNKKYESKDIDFVVFTGDNVDRANPKDLEHFLDIVKKIKIKKYIIVGNHDLFTQADLDHKTYMQTVKQKLGKYHSDKTNYVFKCNGVIFITMNGVKEVIPGPNGYYKDDELAWLDTQLTKYKNNKVVILQHFPILDSHSQGACLWKKEKYVELLKKHNNVMAIVSGHYHNNKEVYEDNIYHIISPRFYGKCYKIIEVDPEKYFIFTTLVDEK